MSRYILRRVGLSLLTVLITSLLIFGITRLLPGDVAKVILGREAGEAALNALREELGLNRPAYVQYVTWLFDFVRGDWGNAQSSGEPIRALVTERLANSLLLAGATLLLTIPLAIGLGAVSGLRAGSALDSVISIAALAVVGLPEFVTGLLLIQLFAFELRWLPASSTLPPNAALADWLRAIGLPAMTAALVLLAYIIRLTRASVVEELKQGYVRTALLKGLEPRQIMLRHVLRNALSPTITVIAISIGWLISGLIVVENVFNYPGVGRLLIFAIDRRDLPMIQAITFVTVLIFTISNLLADLLAAALNPRIRLE